MANPLTRIIGVYTADGSNLFNIDRTDTPTTDYDIALPSGDYFPSGDGSSSDEMQELEDQITGNSGYENFTVEILATGVVRLDCPPGEAYTITWTDTDYRDRLRFTGATTNITSVGINGNRVIKFAVYPQLGIATDDEIVLHRSSQSITDDGIVDTISYGSYREHRIQFQFQGPRRATSYKEYHDLRDFIAQARQGDRFRLYPDRDDDTGDGGTAAYVEFTTPWGYETFVLHPDSMDWDVPPLFGGWYEWFSKPLRLREYVAP
jgi:hypothetical protein